LIRPELYGIVRFGILLWHGSCDLAVPVAEVST